MVHPFSWLTSGKPVGYSGTLLFSIVSVICFLTTLRLSNISRPALLPDLLLTSQDVAGAKCTIERAYQKKNNKQRPLWNSQSFG